MSRITGIALLGAFIVLAPFAAAHADSFVWRISDGDNNVYLAGSVHLLPSDAYPLPEPFGQAFSDAEVVAFETDIDRLESSKVQTRLYHAARYDQGGLGQHLSDRLFADVDDVLDGMGLSISKVRAFRPWFVASMIELSAFKAAGFEKDFGVDVHFYDKAGEADKTILPLESVDRHLQLLTQMPPELARGYLRTTVENVDRLADAPTVVYDYWRAGDADGLAGYVSEQVEAEPALFDRLLFKRNKRWLVDIERLIDGTKDAMVLVGALHLVGERGLVQQLEKRGYEVVRQ